MSNYLAIATVTATLGQLLHKAANDAVPGAGTNTGRPKSTDNGQVDAGINIYLYQVIPNVALRNADLPTRRPDGTLVQRPQTALTLHYLLTFYGKEVQMEPQRLLGSAVSALHAQPVLTQEVIRAAINAAIALDPNHFLANSDLAEQVETIKFAPLPLNLEELSKLWSVFFQTPYALSVAYQASVVLIEAGGTPQKALPIHRAPQVYGGIFRQPAIHQVLAQAGAESPILLGGTLVIKGKQLQGQVTQVRIGDIAATPTSVSDTQISVPLVAPFDALQAGVQAVKIVHLTLMGTPPTLHQGVESNMAAFVLSPTIVEDGGGNAKITLSNLVADNGTRSAQVTVELSPTVGKSQRVVLLLNEANPPSDRLARAYMFDAESRTVDAAIVDFSISGVETGVYLVRVQVDRAESPLDMDADGRYSGPTLTIT